MNFAPNGRPYEMKDQADFWKEPEYLDPPFRKRKQEPILFRTGTLWKRTKYEKELEETLKDRDLYIKALEETARDHGRREIELYQKIVRLEDELRELKENKGYY